MPQISIELTDSEYAELDKLRGSKIWRQFLYETLGLTCELRKKGPRAKETRMKRDVREAPTPTEPKPKTPGSETSKPKPEPDKPVSPVKWEKCCEKCGRVQANPNQRACPDCNRSFKLLKGGE